MLLKNVSEKKLNLLVVDWAIVAVILIVAFFFRLPLLLARETLLPGDEVMFGLMAKHILHGQLPIYYWGQAYLGTLEAYVTAILSLVFGMNGITIQLGGFFFYELFLGVNYFLVKRVLGFRAAFFTSIFLASAPLMMTELSIRALGGYSEILFIGALSLLFWLKVFEDEKSGFLIPLGLTLGLGLWVNSLFIIYLAAFVLMTFFWQGGFEILNPVRVALLKDFSMPVWQKISIFLIHALILFYFIQQIAIFIDPALSHKPAFQWKGVKKILWLISLDAGLLAFFALGWKKFVREIRNWVGLITSFVIGFSPAIFYSLFVGKGYRLLHKSGAVPVNALWTKFQTIFLVMIPKVLWGGNIFVIALFLCGIIYLFWLHRNAPKKSSIFFCFFALSALVITFMSALVADRYLAPFYWVTAVAAGALVGDLMSRTKGLAAFLVIPFVWVNVQTTQAYYSNFKHEDIYGLVRFLEEKGIQGGITDYDNSFRINFYGDERVIFVPLEGMMRHPKYRERVATLKKFALIFPADSPNEKDYLAAHPAFKPLETLDFKTYRIYLVDQSFPIPEYK